MDNTKIYSLTNDNRLVIEFIALGGRIKSVKIPDNDSYIDIIAGHETVQDMIAGDEYMGAICGRVANRIGNGKFTLEGKEIKLVQNSYPNHIHGGAKGFHTKIWNVEKVMLKDYTSAFKLSYLSEDGEEKYPGNLLVEIIYALNNNNELLIDIKATTDKTTAVNLTSHPYFNLNGVGGGKIFNHMLQINADKYTLVDEFSVPTGVIESVKGTHMNFIQPVKLGDVISSEGNDKKSIAGLDNNWVLNKSNENLPLVCSVEEPKSGRAVELYTTQPGVQVYTAMHFDGSDMGKGGIPITSYCGVAMEAQNFPDAINKTNFPNSVLKPDKKYQEKIVYKFIY